MAVSYERVTPVPGSVALRGLASPLKHAWKPPRQNELYAPSRKVDIRLPGKENSKSNGTRPVYSKHLDDEADSDQ